MTAYWISTYLTINDETKLKAYARLALPALISAGGTFLARDLPEAFYESGKNERTVLIEFPSVDDAIAAHESATYQEALAVLGEGAIRDLRIVPGMDRA